MTAPQTLSGPIPPIGGLTLAGNIDIGSNATTIVFATVSGVISSTGAVTMGDGPTRFTGNNTYSGLTTVLGGGQIDGNQPGSDVQVIAGTPDARLSGNGTVGSVATVSSWMSSCGLAPGGSGSAGSPGRLTTGNLTFGDGSYYEVQLNGSLPGVAYDQVAVNGAVTLSGSVNLTLSPGFTPARGQIFVIVDNDAADAVNGIFSGHPQDSTFDIGPYPFEMSYIGKTGNEIILTSLSGDPLNAAPIAVDDNYATPQDSSLSVLAPGVLLNDSEPDMEPVVVIVAPDTTAQGGTLSVDADGSFLYQPPSGFNGQDTFTYVISDGHNATDLATVTITVLAPAAACCASVGTCTLTTEVACVSPNTWHGAGTSCAPNPCEPSGVESGELDGVLGVRAKPNPFAGSVSLRVAGPSGTTASALIFDAAGRLVRTAWTGMLSGRVLTVTWDGRDDSGREAATGIYMVRLESGSGNAIGRLVKLR